MYTSKGELVNLNNYMYSLAGASRSSFAFHFVEGGMSNVPIKVSKTDDYKFDAKALKEGARKRFNVYGTETRKFID